MGELVELLLIVWFDLGFGFVGRILILGPG